MDAAGRQHVIDLTMSCDEAGQLCFDSRGRVPRFDKVFRLRRSLRYYCSLTFRLSVRSDSC